MFGHEIGDDGADGAAADAVLAGQGGDDLAVEVCSTHDGDRVARDSWPPAAFVALGLGGAQSVISQFALEAALEFVGGRRGSAP